MLSRLVIAFLSRSKCLLVSWLQSPSAVILEPRNIKCIADSIHCWLNPWMQNPQIRKVTGGPKYWSFSLSISPSNEYSQLISFRIDWFDLLAVQGILKSLLQYHSSKASVLQHSDFFIIQLSHPYMVTG